jgi:hypothetical protein
MKRTFVVGCPRSGTTIVQAMLARHPAVFTLPETAFFEHVHGNLAWRWGDANAEYRPPRLRQRLGFTRKYDRQLFLSLQRMTTAVPAALPRLSLRMRTLRRRFVALLDELARAADREMWLEKTPNHLLYLPEIEALVPDARFVHVVRPGAETIASLIDASLLFENDNAFGGGTVHWARRWNRAIQIHRAYLHHPQHYLLFPEDLIAQPHLAWKDLCQFLGLDPGLALDDNCTQVIADLEREPWKRRALHGRLHAPESKVDSLFGPKVQRWLQSKLASYDELRAQWMQVRGGRDESVIGRGRNVVALSSGG